MAAGASTGGAACNRSITDFATSAAERRVSGGFGALGSGLRVFGAGLRTGFRVALRTGALAVVAIGLEGRSRAATVVAMTAASTFRRACFAAFFSDLNTLRACLSNALADRTCSFALAARAAALAAAAFSCWIIAGLPAMTVKTALQIRIPGCRPLPRRTPNVPSGIRATLPSSRAPAKSRATLLLAGKEPYCPLVRVP